MTNTGARAAIVIFDGSCPLCSREIAHYQRRPGAAAIEWVDATSQDDRLAQLGLDYAQVMSRFHVADGDQHWHTGAAGFVLLWSSLAGYRWLARIVRGLRLLPVLEWGYQRFLAWRNPRKCDASCATVRDSRR